MTEPNQKQESLPGPDEQASPSPPARAAANNGKSMSRQFKRLANGFEIAMTKIDSRLSSFDARFDLLDSKIESVKSELNGKIESGNRELKVEIKSLDSKIENVNRELKVEIKSLDSKIENVNRELNGKIESFSRELQGFGKRLDGFNLPIILVASFLFCLVGVIFAAFKP
ncbi:MAG: hypothetical protein LBO66_02690 [Deltaproteobacteria bacterium]|jgi:chromosome segregation ATPase|nr:hypothetical protein [Deltaproteobacteria bacterium]